MAKFNMDRYWSVLAHWPASYECLAEDEGGRCGAGDFGGDVSIFPDLASPRELVRLYRTRVYVDARHSDGYIR